MGQDDVYKYLKKHKKATAKQIAKAIGQETVSTPLRKLIKQGEVQVRRMTECRHINYEYSLI